MNNRNYFIFIIFLVLHFVIIKSGIAQTNHLVLQENKVDTVVCKDNQDFKKQITHLPVPEYQSNSSGVVTVEVWVNKKGKVVKTIYDATQSTTTDDQLIKSSLKAAKKAKFIRIETDTIRVGNIKYNFNKL